MSEEIELIIKKIKVAMLKHTQEFYDYDMLVDYELDYNQWKKLLDYINNLQQKVEQLQKENKELKQPQVFIDCENMEERYGRDLYEDYLKEKIEQLENIRKEAIKATKDVKQFVYDELVDRNVSGATETHCKIMDLLSILNKGSDKE